MMAAPPLSLSLSACLVLVSPAASQTTIFIILFFFFTIQTQADSLLVVLV